MKESGRTVAVIGGGGREAALVHKYSQSPNVDRIIAIPGNDMMQETSEKPVVTIPNLKTSDVVEIAILCEDQQVNLVDIAQEDAVRWNLKGQLKLHEINSVGPDSRAGEIETDKNVARGLGNFWDLPQPRYNTFDFEYEEYFKKHGKPVLESVKDYVEKYPDIKWFVKANGLAQGKGVIPADSLDEIVTAIARLRKEFPEASKKILLEHGLTGEEFSAFAVSNGKSFKIIGFAQDHKRAFDNDEGPNTGGMGAVSRPILLDSPELQKQTEQIFKLTFDGMKNSGLLYKGILYLGGMVVNENGQKEVYVIEFNARWGDPEAQVLVPGLEVDLFDLGQRVNEGDFKNFKVKSDGKVRVAVAGAAKGYPGNYSEAKGKEIRGINEARKVDGVTVYGAGVKVIENKHFVNGGRLFYVVAEGKDVIDARNRVYEAMKKITVEGNNLHYRTDIGGRDVERLKNGV